MMESPTSLNASPLPKGFKILMIMVLVIGIFFRCVNLDRKVYWIDETYTSLRVSGYTELELVQQVSARETFGIKELEKYQKPNFEKNLLDTLQGLAKEEPQLAPLYFIFVRFWVQIFGYSVVVTRSFSVFLSILAFPCLYWLCRELFQSSVTAWVALSLLAISPFHILYAQEARPYSLWTLTILFSSAILLQAMRQQNWKNWLLYAVSITVGLSSHLFFALVMLAHVIYIFLGDRILPNISSLRIQLPAKSRNINFFILTLILGIIPFIPWVIVGFLNATEGFNKTSWQSQSMSLLALVQNWLSNLSRYFLDLGFNSNTPSIYLIPIIPFILILVALSFYALYFLIRFSPRKTWLFIVLLMVVTALPFMGSDLILGARRSTLSRYLTPFYLGNHLSIAYLLSDQIFRTDFRRMLWRIGFAALASLGILSAVALSQSDVWWSKYNSVSNPQIAQIINASDRPLLITDTDTKFRNLTNLGNLLSLSYLLNSKVQGQLVIRPNTPKIPEGVTDVFLMNPVSSTRKNLEETYQIKLEKVQKVGLPFYQAAIAQKRQL